MRETELKETLSAYKTNYQEAQEEIKAVQTRIEEYKQNEQSEEATIALLEKDLKEINMKLGKTDVYGEGITITMENTSESTITYIELLQLINELQLAGAEAISINGQRIVSMSYIVEPKSPIIEVNGERISAPYEIKAIGDTTHLQSALSIKGGYIDVYGKNYTINVKTGNITIGKYTGKLTLDYVKE